MMRKLDENAAQCFLIGSLRFISYLEAIVNI